MIPVPPPPPPDTVFEITIKEDDEQYPHRVKTTRNRVLNFIYTERGLEEALCADEIVHAESRWRERAVNKVSGAWGLFQLMHDTIKWNVKKQTELAIKYAVHRYDGFCNALSERRKKGWW
jgi:hypothetical protein